MNNVTTPANLHIFDHPLIHHKLSYIRDRQTNTRDFRRLLSEIATLMTYEVCREFATVSAEVDTPLERTTVRRLAAPITLVPVLRAGLGMTRGVLELLPEARVGHIGIRRDESTALPIGYYTKLPADIAAGPVILVDPMLATGGSCAHAITLLREAKCCDVRVVCLVAAPEGVARLTRDHPTVRIYAAALDRELDSNKYIRPGLGDAGDRCYGTG
ncbi:MAG: uracil phosphoribosyltransferase [Phycisphaerales bacterium]|nr:uracil phosphoribosyltransferase [Phycisphaerales bacterium]